MAFLDRGNGSQQLRGRGHVTEKDDDEARKARDERLANNPSTTALSTKGPRLFGTAA